MLISFFLLKTSKSVCPFITRDCGVVFNSTTGELQTQEFYNISFESECFLNLTNCDVGGCYSIEDMTGSFKVGYAPGISNSLFDQINISGARMRQFRSGISFIPTQATVWLNFSIKNNLTFYTLHPFQPRENITEFEISEVRYGLPVCYGV